MAIPLEANIFSKLEDDTTPYTAEGIGVMAKHISEFVEVQISTGYELTSRKLTPKASFFKRRKEHRQLLKRMYLDGDEEYLRACYQRPPIVLTHPIRELSIRYA